MDEMKVMTKRLENILSVEMCMQQDEHVNLYLTPSATNR